MANSDAADADAGGRPDPPPMMGRCMAAAVTLVAVTLAVSLVVVTRRGDTFGMQFGQREEPGLLREDDQTLHRQEALLGDWKRSPENDERGLLVFDKSAPGLAVTYGYGVSSWQVPPDTFPQTLAFPSDAAQSMGSLEQCQVIAGTALNLTNGGVWIKMAQDAGDQSRWISQDKFKLQKVAFTTLAQPGHTCHEQLSLFPIASMSHCKMAALDMGITKKVLSTWESTWPEGCVVLNHYSTVFLNANPDGKGNDTSGITRLVCSSLEPCVPTSTHTTTATSTTHTTTATSTTHTSTRTTTATSSTHTKMFDGTSLFCFVVAAAQSYEPDLLRFARSQKTGVYGCEEHITLTDSKMDVGTSDDPEMTTAIGSLESDMGDWGSWSNAGVFLKAWKAVMEDGRFRKHDWIVKLDADAVFFSGRLKGHVDQMAVHGQGTPSDLMFLQNWMDEYPVVGAVEVLSRAAVLAFEQRVDECEEIAFGAEDGWFVGCMRVLGARAQRDEELLQHEKNDLGCHNERIVTMHPYKNVDDYRRCLDEANQ